MQTLDLVSGLHNCCEFSKPLEPLYQAMQTQEKSTSAKAILPAKFDARRQLKYNVQSNWSNQIITIYLIGQFKPMK